MTVLVDGETTVVFGLFFFSSSVAETDLDVAADAVDAIDVAVTMTVASGSSFS